MTERPLPAGDLPDHETRPALRASHSDRDRVVEILREAAGDGQLTADELDERVEAALTARTRNELAALTTDLGAGVTRPARELIRIDQRFGDVERTGRWVVPQRMEIKSTAGNVRLDFTEAVLSHRTLHVDVDLGIGSELTLITKPGIVVETDDLTVRLGDVNIRHAADNEPVTLTVVLTGKLHGGDVVARYPRRNFGQWLRREPRPYR